MNKYFLTLVIVALIGAVATISVLFIQSKLKEEVNVLNPSGSEDNSNRIFRDIVNNVILNNSIVYGQETAAEEIITKEENRQPKVNSFKFDEIGVQSGDKTIRWIVEATDQENDPIFYRFWLRGPLPLNEWELEQDWSVERTWDWTPGLLGNYSIKVEVGDDNNVKSNTVSDQQVRSYCVMADRNEGQKDDIIHEKNPACLISLRPSIFGIQPIGTTVTWTAEAIDPDYDVIYYKFWLSGPSSDSWVVVRDWQTQNWWNWTPTKEGDYHVKAQVGGKNDADYVEWDDSRIESYTIRQDEISEENTVHVTENRSPTLRYIRADKIGIQPVGTNIKLIAEAIDPDEDIIYYNFWLNGSSTENKWKLVQDWSTQNSFEWIPTNADNYLIGVGVTDKNRARSEGWDDFKNINYTIQDSKGWLIEGNDNCYIDRYDRAIECYDEAIEIDSEYADAWYNKGVVYLLDQNFVNAIECFDRSIQIDSEYSDVWNNRGIAFVKKGIPDYDEAVKCYDEAIQIELWYADAWYNKGIALYKQSKYNEAIECFDYAIQIDPEYYEAWYLKGRSLKSLGRTDEGNEAIDHAKLLCDCYLSFTKYSVALVRSLNSSYYRNEPETVKRNCI